MDRSTETARGGFDHWRETHDAMGRPREAYERLMGSLKALTPRQLKAISHRLDATMREMGVTFGLIRDRPWGRRLWLCDLMPQIFRAEEWDLIESAMRQRLRMMEAFLTDIYSERSILRDGLLPVQPVLGSRYHQLVARSLPRKSFLHLSGAAICRLPDGTMAFKHYYFSNASGISYMIQNRRALARVIPQSFGDLPIRSIALSPVDILELLRGLSDEPEPTVVLLSPGPGSAVFSEHSFLARRMGIPVVQGGDLVVLNDSVYLKTVSGLEKVDVIYSRLADPWLDPLVFRSDSLLGVPGLVHCIRKKKVTLVNSIGSQLADDRAILPFSSLMTQYYLGERLVLPTVPTFWLGDIDQKEHVIDELWKYTIRPLYGERILLGGDGRIPSARAVEAARRAILKCPASYVAQPQECDALAVTFEDGLARERLQDHIIFGIREPNGNYKIFPGALTRVATASSPFTANELGGGSKDTWVESSEPELAENVPSISRDIFPPASHVSSRVAESFYWLGRYFERAYSLAVMIRVIADLELEELNPAERMLYRPVWNQLLPPLENPEGVTRRNISSQAGRYRLALDLSEPDSVTCAVLRAARNADSILDLLSLEALRVVENLRGTLSEIPFNPEDEESRQAAAIRKVCEEVCSRVPEFFGVAEATMLADGAWVFCEVGQKYERALITANALRSVKPSAEDATGAWDSHEQEIQLSAFLRLLESRDIYRRLYQMRVEKGLVFELLWSNEMAPRSVLRCLNFCSRRLKDCHGVDSPGTRKAVEAIENLAAELGKAAWLRWSDEEPQQISKATDDFLAKCFSLHQIITDGFINHQIHIKEINRLGAKNAF